MYLISIIVLELQVTIEADFAALLLLLMHLFLIKFDLYKYMCLLIREIRFK